jgi:Bifunctional DNA primase/polymerase, N-terminal
VNIREAPGPAGQAGNRVSVHAGNEDSTSVAPASGMLLPALQLADQGAENVPLYWPIPGGCSCVAGAACNSPGKHPIPVNGHKAATSDVARIVRWWTETPQANVGIRPSVGVVVLDVDPRNGGATALVDLLDGRKLPQTLTAQTGGGGLHIWLRCPPPTWGYRRKLITGVDIKTHDGLVVAPPSRHTSGRRYAWANDLEIAPAPDWLLPMLARPQPAPRRSIPARYRTGTAKAQRLRVEALCHRVASVPEGGDHLTEGRNSTLHWAAMRLVEDGLDDLASIEALRDAAASAGLPDSEIKVTLRSGLRRAGSPLAEAIR